jgi:predicted nucleotidyltransferase
MHMRRIPPLVAGTLRRLTSALDQILGPQLIGAYLYGSLTQGAFDPARSDLDCVVVVRRDLTHAQFRKLATWLGDAAEGDAWIGRLQMQILLRSHLLRPDERGALYQFGVLRRSGSDGNPIIWRNVLASGVTLAGPSPGTFLPRITDRMMVAALRREIEYLRTELVDPASPWRDRRSYRAYAVLTVCRILYSNATNDVVSKRRAARWALRTLPTRWHALIRAAVASDRGEASRLPVSRIVQFIEFADQQLVHIATRSSKHRGKRVSGSPFPA